jgi:acyl-CoA thioester hydrolase
MTETNAVGSEAAPAGYGFAVDIGVRYRDADAMGHVNNAVYGTYLEQARVAYFDRVLDVPIHERDMVLAHVELDFRASVTLAADRVRVAVRVASLGESSFRMTYEVRTPEGDVAATGESVQVAVDREGDETTGSRPVPEGWRERITAFEPALES